MSPSKKRHASESQDDDSYLSPLKKRIMTTDVEEMDSSKNQNSQASSVVCELGENDLKDSRSKKKKKKKKHKELEDTVLEDESGHTENVLEENEENAVENSSEASKKKKKKKKKKHRAEDDEHINNETENEDDTEMSFDETKRMFEDIQEKLVEDKNISYKHFWENYRLKPYSSKTCKEAFEKIMTKVQKKRTFFELVDAAGKLLTETPTVFCVKKFKDLRPVTPYKLFSQKNYKKFSDKHPESRGIDILNKITKKWGKLSDQKKLKYIDLALAKRSEYMEDVRLYQKIDSSFVPKPVLSKIEWQIKERCAGLPHAPPSTGFYSFFQKSSELYPDLPQKDRYNKLMADFKSLPAEVKEKYNSQVKEEKKKYAPLLQDYLDSLSPSDLEDRNLAITPKSKPKPVKKKEPVESFLSNKPPMSGYALFFKELHEELKGIPLIKRQMMVSERWRALEESERRDYNQRRLALHEEWLKDLKTKVTGESSDHDD